MALPITAGALAGEYMETLVILEWRVALGDTVSQGDVLLTIETAKAAVEVEAPVSGVISGLFAEAGSEVPAASVLCLIGESLSDASYVADGERGSTETQQRPLASTSVDEIPAPIHRGSRIVASPAARRAAQRASVELSTIQPTSPSGRIKLRDVVKAQDEAMANSGPAIARSVPDESGPLRVHRSGKAEGSPVFLIHGFASDSLSWYPLERELAKSHRVYRLDLPNHGGSPKRSVGSFANLVREVRAAFDGLDLAGAHVIGHSLGGALALALADTRPREVASLCLLAPGGLGPGVNGDFIAGIARSARPESLEAWLKVMVHDETIIDKAFVSAAFSARRDPVLRQAQVHMGETLFPDSTQSFDLKAALHRISIPTRIVWGRNDAVLPWQGALQAPGHAGIHLLQNVGHVPQLESPELVLTIVNSLIKSV